MMKIQLKKWWQQLMTVTLGMALWLGAPAQALSQTVTGTVTDEGEALPGVSILVKGTTQGTITDIDGKYSIQAPGDATLIVSFVGYVTQEVAVNGRSNLDVVLEADIAQLEEVVVIGYGTAKKSDLTGSLAQVTAESFEAQPIARVEDALQGRASGVIVSRTSGQPGAGVKIRVRGVNSITGNNAPLVVIDGIIGGDLATLNPNDIESFDVLKDASATAIYGSRGSNGVIMVTTKRGSGKGKINVEYFGTSSSVPDNLDQLGVVDFAIIENQRRVRTGGSPIFTDQEIDQLRTTGGTDYQDEIFQRGFSHNLRLSASGQEGKFNYFISGDYVDQEGIVINTGFKRLSVRSNLGVQVNEKIRVNANIFGTRSENHNDFNRQNLFQGSPIFKAVTWDPTTPVFNEDGGYNFRSIKGIASLNDNPVFVLSESDFNDIIDRVNGNLDFSYDIIEGLNYRLLAGVSLINSSAENYAVETGDLRLPNASFGGNKSTLYQLSNILTWQREFGIHNVKVTGLYEYSFNENRFNGYSANGLTLPNGFYQAELAPNSGQVARNGYTKTEVSSVMFRGEYNLASNLFVTGTVRIDNSSVFRPENRTGVFPSVAAGYSFADLVPGDMVSELKLRAGWGQVGNQNVGAFSTFGTLTFNSYAFDGASAVAGTEVASRENADLQWETTTQTNIGVDLGLFQGRANLSVDWYTMTTSDLLLDVPLADVDGGGSVLQNVGEVQNTGIDLSLDFDVLDIGGISWNTILTYSYVQNEVTKLFSDVEEIEGTFNAPGGQSRRANIIQLGEPLGQFQGSTFLGTWKSTDTDIPDGLQPGDPRYLMDDDGNIVFGAIGNGTPTTFWGWNNTVTYKGF
ncbi:MAG: SusC/RagA family TonB-linked outer membrane protein, partial [Bacteroidota bacterium]